MWQHPHLVAPIHKFSTILISSLSHSPAPIADQSASPVSSFRIHLEYVHIALSIAITLSQVPLIFHLNPSIPVILEASFYKVARS